MDDDELTPPPAPVLAEAIQAERARLAQIEAENEEHNARIAEWQDMERQSPEFAAEWRQRFRQAATRMGIEPRWPAVMRLAEEAGIPGVRSEPEALSFLAQLEHRADTGQVTPEDIAFLDTAGRANQRTQSHAPVRPTGAQMANRYAQEAAPEWAAEEAAAAAPPGLSPGYVESMVRRSGTGNGISPGYIESLERTRNWDQRETPEQQGTLRYLTPEAGLQNPAPPPTALQQAVAPAPAQNTGYGARRLLEEEEMVPLL